MTRTSTRSCDQWQPLMAREVPRRCGITERKPSSNFVAEAARVGEVDENVVRVLIARANRRLMAQLGLTNPPLELSGDAIQAVGITGLLRLSPRLELEVAPKYLGIDAENWREDFFFIANISRFGKLLPHEMLSTDYSGSNSLTNLIAGALVGLYWENYRRPLRTYRTKNITEFELVGDADPEDLVLPAPDGFPQRITALTRHNPYNSAMNQAARQLLPGVDNADIRGQLVRMTEHLSPQAARTDNKRLRVPARHERWRPTYDLALQVLSGYGVDLSLGRNTTAPGFVLKSAKGWEDLIIKSVQLGVRDAEVSPHRNHTLGLRNDRRFSTNPDVTLQFHNCSMPLLVDAKYIGRSGDVEMRIAAGDVYEGLAFLRAARAEHLVLLYPKRLVSAPQTPTRSPSYFEHIEVGDHHIYGYEVDPRGISARGGFRSFIEQVSNVVHAHADARPPRRPPPPLA